MNKSVNYYPFGMRMPNRSWSVTSDEQYRFGFNGKEKEIQTNEDNYNYGYRIYNAQIGKFLSMDPLSNKFPWYAPYQFAGNKPIMCIDIDGCEDSVIITLEYYQNSTLINMKTVRQKLPEQGSLGDGNSFYRYQFYQEGPNEVHTFITGEYFEQNEDGVYLDNYHNLGANNDPIVSDVEQTKMLWKSTLKPGVEVEYMGVLEEWIYAHADQEAIAQLAEGFGDHAASGMDIDGSGNNRVSRHIFTSPGFKYSEDTGLYIFSDEPSKLKYIGGPFDDTVVGVKDQKRFMQQEDDRGWMPIRDATEEDKQNYEEFYNENEAPN